MTRLMQQAIDRLKALPEGQQDGLAEFLLHELAEDERWAKTSSEQSGKLKALVGRILDDDSKGKCTPLEPDRL
jgi:hypothetical protein